MEPDAARLREGEPERWDDPNRHLGADWIPPTSPRAAEDLIATLVSEVDFINLQLAEGRAAWCARTGRAPGEFAAWRRRAFLAKLHKDNQLREARRIRHQLLASAREAAPAHSAGREQTLSAACRRVLNQWDKSQVDPTRDALGRALAELALRLEGHSQAEHHIDVVGTPG